MTVPIGFILHGFDKIGTFESAEEEDYLGLRILNNIKINKNYIDLSINQTNIDLNFMIVLPLGDISYTILKGFGYGMLFDINLENVENNGNLIMKSAKFLKMPKGGRNAN